MREAKFVLAIGKKGVGKTYETLKEISRYVRATGRKVLILDVNNEYGNVRKDHNNDSFPHIRALAPKDVLKWTVNGIPEVRRIAPIDEKGRALTTDEIKQLMFDIIHHFKNGALILEDITRIVSDSVSNVLIGALATQRHASVDMYMHFQSIQKAGHPKLWALCTTVRMHKCEDEVYRHEKKFSDVTSMYLTENIVRLMEKQDKRFCAFLHKEERKIMGKFNKKHFEKAIEMFLQDNMAIYNRELNRIDLRTGKKIHKSAAA